MNNIDIPLKNKSFLNDSTLDELIAKKPQKIIDDPDSLTNPNEANHKKILKKKSSKQTNKIKTYRKAFATNALYSWQTFIKQKVIHVNK